MAVLSLIERCSSRLRTLSWLRTHLDAIHAGVDSRRFLVGVVVAVASAAFAGAAATVAVPLWAIIVLSLLVSLAWWLWLRVVDLNEATKPKLSFFSGDNGPLRLSEDLTCSRIVYCIGVRNDGLTTVRDVHVDVDVMEGLPGPTFPARLKVFRGEQDCADLHPNETEYFCVMKIAESSEGYAGNANLCCHHDLMSASVHLLELLRGRVITVSAYGDGTPKITNKLRVVSKYDRAGWSLDMRLTGALA